MTNNKLPANTWEVTLMVRKQDAIGIFYQRVMQVRAWPEKVVEWAIADAHDEGFEVLGVNKTERIA